MTTGIAEPSPAAPVAAPPAKNSFQRIAGVLFAPADTFRDIARKPDFVVPMIVLVVLAYLGMAVIAPRMDFSAALREQMEAQGRQMSDADMARMEKMAGVMGKVTAFAGPLFGIVWWLVIAAILWGAHRMFGGEGDFLQAFSTTLYAWFPMAIAGIVLAIVAFSRTSIDPQTMQTLVKSNLGFLTDIKEHPMLFALLSSVDIFMIWTLILLIIGFSTLSRLSRAKSAAIVISLWLVTVVVKLGFAALGAMRMKKA